MEAGREFRFLEVIGTNVLANEVVRHFSNLTVISLIIELKPLKVKCSNTRCQINTNTDQSSVKNKQLIIIFENSISII